MVREWMKALRQGMQGTQGRPPVRRLGWRAPHIVWRAMFGAP